MLFLLDETKQLLQTPLKNKASLQTTDMITKKPGPQIFILDSQSRRHSSLKQPWISILTVLQGKYQIVSTQKRPHEIWKNRLPMVWSSC